MPSSRVWRPLERGSIVPVMMMLPEGAGGFLRFALLMPVAAQVPFPTGFVPFTPLILEELPVPPPALHRVQFPIPVAGVVVLVVVALPIGRSSAPLRGVAILGPIGPPGSTLVREGQYQRPQSTRYGSEDAGRRFLHKALLLSSRWL